ncbi:hypothetical protein PV768_06330, partial [Pseudarthrobacter sp. CC4]|uniref:hypothetical protein n=1 Tax=Pseudarthrobacter sp. CC4 TaxID=3029190 RepID=UPI003B8D0047
AGQFYWPSVGNYVAAYGQFFMAAYTRSDRRLIVVAVSIEMTFWPVTERRKQMDQNRQRDSPQRTSSLVPGEGAFARNRSPARGAPD